MNIDFSQKDVLLIYGHFVKQIKKLEELKAASSGSIISINEELRLYSSITKKIEAAYPNISELAKHL